MTNTNKLQKLLVCPDFYTHSSSVAFADKLIKKGFKNFPVCGRVCYMGRK